MNAGDTAVTTPGTSTYLRVCLLNVVYVCIFESIEVTKNTQSGYLFLYIFQLTPYLHVHVMSMKNSYFTFIIWLYFLFLFYKYFTLCTLCVSRQDFFQLYSLYHLIHFFCYLIILLTLKFSMCTEFLSMTDLHLNILPTLLKFWCNTSKAQYFA